MFGLECYLRLEDGSRRGGDAHFLDTERHAAVNCQARKDLPIKKSKSKQASVSRTESGRKKWGM